MGFIMITYLPYKVGVKPGGPEAAVFCTLVPPCPTSGACQSLAFVAELPLVATAPSHPVAMRTIRLPINTGSRF